MNKKKKKKTTYVPQYFLGGSLEKLLPSAAGAAASFIPGVGPAVAPFVAQGVGSLVAEDGTSQQRPSVSTTGGSYGMMAQGGAMNFMGQNAFAFTGPSHEGGGIQLPNAEVEGGETMDFIEFRNGGKMIDTRDGSPYIFSKRLTVPETNTTFADTHKKLVKDNANEDDIRNLAMMQEKISGRSSQGQSMGAEGYTQPGQQTNEFLDEQGAPFMPTFDQQMNTAMPMSTGADTPDVDPEAKSPRKQYPNMTKRFVGAQGGKMKMQAGGTPPLVPPANPPFYVDPFGGASKNPGSFNFKQLGSNRGVPALRNLPEKGLNTLYKAPGLLAKGLSGVGGGAATLLMNPETIGDSSLGDRDIPRDIAFPNERQAEVEDSGDRNLGRVSMRGRHKQPSTSDKPSAPNTAPTDEIVDDVNIPGLGIQRAQLPTGETPQRFSSDELAAQTVGDGQSPVTEGANVADQVSQSEGEGMSAGMETALQFLPDAMNALTGIFGKGDTPEPTRVDNRSVNMMDPRVNVNPQLLRNTQSYQAILADPNATMNQKLAAQSSKMQADSSVYADKFNRENQMKSNQARLQANLDTRNAGFSNQARSERMMSDAMFGLTGNMARGAVASASQKLLQRQAMGNQKRQNDTATMAIIGQLDPALQEKYIKQLGLFQ